MLHTITLPLVFPTISHTSPAQNKADTFSPCCTPLLYHFSSLQPPIPPLHKTKQTLSPHAAHHYSTTCLPYNLPYLPCTKQSRHFLPMLHTITLPLLFPTTSHTSPAQNKADTFSPCCTPLLYHLSSLQSPIPPLHKTKQTLSPHAAHHYSTTSLPYNLPYLPCTKQSRHFLPMLHTITLPLVFPTISHTSPAQNKADTFSPCCTPLLYHLSSLQPPIPPLHITITTISFDSKPKHLDSLNPYIRFKPKSSAHCFLFYTHTHRSLQPGITTNKTTTPNTNSVGGRKNFLPCTKADNGIEERLSTLQKQLSKILKKLNYFHRETSGL
ncbi:hypothetical protein BgiBS90_002734 [Biomphalaria glabrata]|nr:hypothetical protein BgiBS90_002734 [Biomphalaria glabrata]